MTETRLEDLFKRGEALTLVDGPREVTVYVAKLTRPHRMEATQRADAARARVIALRKDTESDAYMALRNAVFEMTDREQLVAMIIGEDVMKTRLVRQAEIEHDEKWSEDNYLVGLRRSWNDGLAERHLENPEDAESSHVFDELSKFLDEVDEAVDHEIKDLRAQYDEMSIEDLQEAAMPAVLTEAADTAWTEEYHRCRVWKGTYKAVRRGEDEAGEAIYVQGDPYFKHRHQVDQLDDEVYKQLHDKLQEVNKDGYQGKASPESPASSTSSDQPAEVETAASSGQPVAQA